MKSKSRNKRLLIVLLILTTCSFTLTACNYDLGDYKDIEEYYSTFGDIHLYSKESKWESFTMEDFYNKETAGGSDGSTITTEVEEKTYLYLFFKIKEDAVVDDIALYFYSSSSQEEDSLSWDIFHIRNAANLIDILKPKPYNYVEPTEEEEEEQQEEYNDVDTVEGAALVNSSNIRVKNEWTSLMVSSWTTSDGKESKIEVEADDYFVFRFKNNCYAGRLLNLNQVSFTATNLLVRALKED